MFLVELGPETRYVIHFIESCLLPSLNALQQGAEGDDERRHPIGKSPVAQ